MLNSTEIMDTIHMIEQQHLDIRTITMGISLLDCISEDPKRCCDKIYDKITHYAEHLVKTGEDIESEFGIPIVNKRISVTPMALVAGACDTEDLVPFALTMDRAAKTCGVNFIGGFSALVQKGFARGDELLLRAVPPALAGAEFGWFGRLLYKAGPADEGGGGDPGGWGGGVKLKWRGVGE